jgi:hypothetical protein
MQHWAQEIDQKLTKPKQIKHRNLK